MRSISSTEWSAHEPAGLRAGLGRSVIDIVKYDSPVDGLAEKDATLIRFFRALLPEHRVTCDLFANMIAVYGKQRTVEMMELAGDYWTARGAHGAPRYLRSDNGPEFVATAVLRWVQTVAIETAFIDPGKPWQNGTDESFNGKFRNECLTLEWFRNRLDAKVGIEQWRRHYNEERPHMSLGDQTPAEFKAQITNQTDDLVSGRARSSRMRRSSAWSRKSAVPSTIGIRTRR